MDYSQYTPDAIARAMGFETFAAITNNFPKPALAVLLQPSFHPEACIAIWNVPEGAQLMAITLEENLWFQKFPRAIPAFRDTRPVPTPTFDELTALAITAHAAASAPDTQKWVFLDGMNAHIALFGEIGFEFHAHCGVPSVGDFAMRLIEHAWTRCQDQRVKNGLAHCAGYVGLNLPIRPDAIPNLISRILVLGTNEDRTDLRNQVDAAKGTGKLK